MTASPLLLPPPIVVVHARDVMFFRSQADAERAVDPRDVAGGAYRAWDGSGRELRLDIGDAVCIDVAPVFLSVPAKRPGSSDDLATILREFLSTRGAPPRDDAALDELLNQAVARAGFTE